MISRIQNKDVPSLAELAVRFSSASATDVEAFLAELPLVEAAPAPSAAAKLPTSVAAIRAAIADTFLIDEVAKEEGDREPILENAVPVVVDGRSRLRLTHEARATLWDRAGQTPTFQALLRDAIARDQRESADVMRDPARHASAWLRRFLSGERRDFAWAPLNELQAALSALEALQATSFGNKAAFNLAGQQLQLAELLEPLRILIGATGGWSGRPYQDRFAGRAKELEQLREFVDGIESQTRIEHFRRSLVRTIRTHFEIPPAELLVIEGQGGLGKSSLVARFVLEHALTQKGPRFPFAYIDFDRGAVEPRDPRHLLVEVLRQVALQFPTVQSQLDALRERVRAGLRGGVTQSGDLYAALRDIMVADVGLGDRPFLVVLDTLEAAQNDAACIAGIDRFLMDLAGAGLPGLRVVISGRSGPGQMQFRLETVNQPTITLDPLGVMDARDMANALGRSILGDQTWKPSWATLIAGRGADPGERREPLSVRVAVDTLCGAPAAEREALAAEIGRMGEKASGSFVGRLYQKRILDHVRHPDAKQLAWPGLVIRNVTRKILDDLLGPLCGVASNKLDEAFAELGKYAWMVERRSEGGEEVLRHRRDLRARTLPLMQRHNPDLFLRINSAAISYFEASAREPRAHAEWLYHRLLAGDSAQRIDLDWIPEVAPYLADAAEDFDPDSEARSYLIARTNTRPARIAAVRKMPAWVAFEYLANTPRAFGDFDDARLQASLLDLAERKVEVELSREADAARRTLLIKVGQWEAEDPAIDVGLPNWRTMARFARAYKRARQRRSWLANEEEAFVYALPDPPDFRVLTQELALARQSRDPRAPELDLQLATALETLRLSPSRMPTAVLRAAALFGAKSYAPAARHWAAARAAQSDLITASRAELRAIHRFGIVSRLEPSDARLLSAWCEAAEADASAPGRAEDPELSAVLGRLLERLRIGSGEDVESFVRNYLAIGREDWLTPMAYSAARALAELSDRALDPLLDRLATYPMALAGVKSTTAAPASTNWLRREPRDLIALLRRADEAGDLAGMAMEIFQLAQSSPSAWDLRLLLDAEARWSEEIAVSIARATPRDLEDGPTSDQPPRAGPIKVENDPQKGRWGGLAERNGRRLQATLVDTSSSDSLFVVHIVVESIDNTPLVGPVVFHLHPTFQHNVIRVGRVQDARRAGLYDVTSYGAFTVGAQARDGAGRWIGLELDLADLPDLPKPYRDR